MFQIVELPVVDNALQKRRGLQRLFLSYTQIHFISISVGYTRPRILEAIWSLPMARMNLRACLDIYSKDYWFDYWLFRN